MHSCRVRDISVNFLSCVGDVLAEFETFYAVVIPLSGKVASRVSQRACVAPERAPLRFESPMDVGGYAMSWYRLLRVMIDELDRSGSLLETAAKARGVRAPPRDVAPGDPVTTTSTRWTARTCGRFGCAGGVLGAEGRGDR
jgi:hypothetical protein